MAGYIGIAVTVILAIFGSTWRISSKITELQVKQKEHSQKIKDLEKAVNSYACCNGDDKNAEE